MDLSNVASAIESILLAADRPVTVDRLSEVFGDTGPSKLELEEAIEIVRKRYTEEEYGFELRQAQGGFQFSTKAKNAEWVRRFLETKPFRLGRSALEVLAIIAYRQPITRAEIDQVRGIDSSHLMRTLMERALVKMAGKAEVPGRPVQYCTTPRFIEVMGLNSLSELPPLSELQQLQGDTEDPMKSLETGLDRFISEDLNRQVGDADTQELQSGLQEIETIIDSADRSQDEVYESKEQAESARSNQEALKAFQEMTPMRRRKKTVTFDELSAHTHSGEAPGTQNTAEAAPEISEPTEPTSEEAPVIEPAAMEAETAQPELN